MNPEPLPRAGDGDAQNAAGDDSDMCSRLDIDHDGESDFQGTGWSIGPLANGTFEYDILVSTDADETQHVGVMNVDYMGEQITFRFNFFPGYGSDQLNLYVGHDILPLTADGAYTIAPEHYGFAAQLEAPWAGYELSGRVGGQIHLIAQMNVCGPF